MWLIVAQRIVFDFVFHLVYFPVWWYSAGLVHTGRGCLHLIQTANYTLAPGLWLRNIFVPIYGADDWQGRIISFFLRLANVIVRSIALALWALFVLFLFALWLLLPIFFAYMIIRSVTGYAV